MAPTVSDFRRLEEAIDRLERIAERLLAGIERVVLVEDRLDRQRRPFGDGRR